MTLRTIAAHAAIIAAATLTTSTLIVAATQPARPPAHTVTLQERTP